MQSNTETQDPKRALPHALAKEPQRTKLRNDKALEKQAMSKDDNDEPKRTIDTTETALPNRENDRTEMLEPASISV